MAALTYRVYESEGAYFELLGGAQYTYLSTELTLSTTGPLPISSSLGGSQGWVDPIVGAFGKYYFNEEYYTFGGTTIGGFGVSSDIVWTLGAGIGYQLSPRVALEALYRYAHYDYHRDLLFDVDMHGPFLGVSIDF